MKIFGYGLVLCSCLLFVFAAGCGKGTNEIRGGVSIIDGPISKVADNAAIQSFNQQLGNINDQQSAEKAVYSFVDYVDTRIVKPKGVTTASLRSLLNTDLISSVARQEVAVRAGGSVTVSTIGGAITKPLLDVGTITDAVNELGADDEIRVSDEIISKATEVVEESIPNMNTRGDKQLTPLEAMVVAYALTSGDDGTASPEAVVLPVEKVSKFMEIVTQ